MSGCGFEISVGQIVLEIELAPKNILDQAGELGA